MAQEMVIFMVTSSGHAATTSWDGLLANEIIIDKEREKQVDIQDDSSTRHLVVVVQIKLTGSSKPLSMLTTTVITVIIKV